MLYDVSVWEIEFTDQFERWWENLDEGEQEHVTAAVEFLEEQGPTLGRPFVDTIKSSRHSNIKELRPPSERLRVLFAFDPRRVAILLLAGDKTDDWAGWYERNVPIADALYDDHLDTIRRELEKEGKPR